jgi:hypothetical protein
VDVALERALAPADDLLGDAEVAGDARDLGGRSTRCSSASNGSPRRPISWRMIWIARSKSASEPIRKPSCEAKPFTGLIQKGYGMSIWASGTSAKGSTAQKRGM